MLDRIEEAIEAIKDGKLVIVVDDEDRENEGDFIVAARHATNDWFTFCVACECDLYYFVFKYL